MKNKDEYKKIEDKILRSNDVNDMSIYIDRLNSSDLDFSDIYFSDVVRESWELVDSKISSASFSIVKGVGVRGVKGEETILTTSNIINDSEMNTLVNAVVASKSSNCGSRNEFSHNFSNPKIALKEFDPIDFISRDEKVRMMNEIDDFVRNLDSRVIQVSVSLNMVDRHNLLFTSDYNSVSFNSPDVVLSIYVQVMKDGRIEAGSNSGGKSGNADFLYDEVPVLPSDYIYGISQLDLTAVKTEKRYLAIAREALRVALVNLESKEFTAGNFPVALANGWPGVLIHEAIGHGLEADSIRKKASIFVDKIGEQVTSPLCTIVDDGTLERGTGSFDYDSEGTPSQYNVLIENGVLKTYMYDKLNAKLMGAKPTGNGRRQGYGVVPIPRMTNTYMLPGESDPKDIIKSIDKGIYAIRFEGGQVNPASGNFTFGASEAYYVENGEICYPIKGVTLIGNCIDVMKKVSMVGNDLKFDKGVGRCGKQGQSVPVGIGQPTLRLDSITIGGTK